MKRRTQNLGSTEEDSCFGWCVDLADGLEDHVPVGATKVGGCAETGDGVLLGVCVVDHDVGGIVCFDLGSEILRVQVSENPNRYSRRNLRCESQCGHQDPELQ